MNSIKIKTPDWAQQVPEEIWLKKLKSIMKVPELSKPDR